MGQEIVVEDYMLEEIDTMKYYLSKDEFEDSMLHFEQHKPKFNTVGRKPIEFVTIKRRVFDYSSNFNEFGVAGTSYSSSIHEESPDLCKKKQQLALQAIAEYYDRRGLKRKLGFAGLGNDEDRQQRKKTVIVDTSNLNILADACCSIAVVKQPVIRLKVIPPAVKPVIRLKEISPAVNFKPVIRLRAISPAATEDRSEIAKATSRKIVKVKKSGNTSKTKKGRDTGSYDVPLLYVLPPEYREKIQELNGWNVQLVEQKPLTASDVNPNLCRLLLNQKNLVNKPKFLTNDEENKIAQKDEYIKAKLLEPMGCYQEIRVKKWFMNHNSYNTLLKPWKELAASNGFGVNDVVQVWTFRFDDEVPNKLGVIVVRIFTAPREDSTTSGDSSDGNGSSLCSS